MPHLIKVYRASYSVQGEPEGFGWWVCASQRKVFSGALNRIRESVTHDAIINMRAEMQQLSQVTR